MQRKLLIGLIILVFASPLFPIYLIYLLFSRNKTQGRVIPTLLIESYEFKRDDPDNVILDIHARHRGIIAWILSIMGIGAKSHLLITRREVKVSLSYFSGTTHFVAPLEDIRATDLSLEKSMWQLYLALLIVAIMILNFFTPMLIGFGPYSNPYGASLTMNTPILVVGGIAIAILLYSYWRSIRFVVAFTTSELSQRYGMAFKPTSSVNFDTLLSHILYVNDTLVAAHFPKRKRKN